MTDLVRQLHIFLQNVGWRDVVDVIFVAVLLYQLFKLIRGTQAVQLLAGLAVLFIIGVVAQALHLRLLEFIFANGGQAILIAVIVLFQPELRRALDQVGRLGRVRGFVGSHQSGHLAETMIREVLRAALRLSEQRTGALIVFERETGLENVAVSGVRIDGDVTAEMLLTIFFEGSPLHDGAVIIHDRRLVSAGCVLPLAEAIPGSGRMGTRHRAALGLTIQSDAVVLIVSEETGLISVANQGKLFRGLDDQKLKEMLVTLVSGPVRRRTVSRAFSNGRIAAALGRRPTP
ncbi:MAG: diadenylate cyclase CdaA [Candidatus Dormibacteria bacterium]